jgi:hypothetical protein
VRSPIVVPWEARHPQCSVWETFTIVLLAMTPAGLFPTSGVIPDATIAAMEAEISQQDTP